MSGNIEVFPPRFEGKENDEGSVLEVLGWLDDDVVEEPLLPGLVNRARRRPRGQLTAHFNIREFYCKDGTAPLASHRKTYAALCRQYLEPMRKRFGPCTITSGRRTPSWNRKVGGEKGSVHVNEWQDPNDVAADAYFERGTPEQWASYANSLRARKRNHKGGIGKYPRKGFVHVDTRDYQADWTG